MTVSIQKMKDGDYILLDEEARTVIEALEAAKPIIDRQGTQDEVPECECESCTQDKAVREAFAKIDFTSA